MPIRELLAARGLTIEALFEFVGVKKRAVDRWLAGDEQPSEEHLRRLMEFFQCDRLELIPGPDPHLLPATQELVEAYKQLSEPVAEVVRRAIGLAPKS